MIARSPAEINAKLESIHRSRLGNCSKPDDARLFEVLEGIARVYNQLRPLHDPLVVEAGVICDNHDGIGRSNSALKFLSAEFVAALSVGLNLPGQLGRLAIRSVVSRRAWPRAAITPPWLHFFAR